MIDSFLEKPIVTDQTLELAMTRSDEFGDVVVDRAIVPPLEVVDVDIVDESSMLFTGECFFLFKPNSFLIIFRNMEQVKQ